VTAVAAYGAKPSAHGLMELSFFELWLVFVNVYFLKPRPRPYNRLSAQYNLWNGEISQKFMKHKKLARWNVCVGKFGFDSALFNSPI
jgi:hypothetical protein